MSLTGMYLMASSAALRLSAETSGIDGNIDISTIRVTDPLVSWILITTDRWNSLLNMSCDIHVSGKDRILSDSFAAENHVAISLHSTAYVNLSRLFRFFFFRYSSNTQLQPLTWFRCWSRHKSILQSCVLRNLISRINWTYSSTALSTSLPETNSWHVLTWRFLARVTMAGDNAILLLLEECVMWTNMKKLIERVPTNNPIW